mgnify:CR=1 FL=1
MAFQGLSVSVSAATADFQAGMQAVKRGASGASLSLRRLGLSADEAEDEIDSAGRSATATAGMFTSLSLSTNGAALSFGTLSTALTATLIPAFIALSTVVVPLAATLGAVAAAAGGLAAAFGAVVGSGLIAFGEKRGEQNAQRLEETQARIEQLEALREETGSLTEAQQDELETLREQAETLEEQTGIMGGLRDAIGETVAEIRPMIVAFGQQFIPLIEDAIEAIPQLVENILGAVGGMGQFKNALRDAGEAAMDAIPNMVATLMDLARDALPALRDAAVWLLNNGGEIFQGMVDTAREVGPELVDLAQTTADLLPKINEMGTAILETLLPAMEDLTEALEPVVGKMTEFVEAINTGDFSEFADMDEITLSFDLAELDISAADLVGGAIAASAIVSAIGWPVIGALAITGAITWGKVQGGQVVDAITWGTITVGMLIGAIGWPVIGGSAIVSALTFQNIAGGDIVEAIGWGTVSGAMVLSVVFGAVSITAGGVLGAVFAGTSVLVGDVLSYIFPNVSISEGDILGLVFAGLTITAAGTLAAIGWPVIGAGGVLAAVFSAAVVTTAALLDYIFPMTITKGDVMDALFGGGGETSGADSPGTIGSGLDEDTPDTIDEYAPGAGGGGEEQEEYSPSMTAQQRAIFAGGMPSAATGGLIERSGLLNVHAGERVVPASQVSDRGQVQVKESGPVDVTVRFEGDGEVVDLVRREAEVVVDRREELTYDRVRRMGKID